MSTRKRIVSCSFLLFSMITFLCVLFPGSIFPSCKPSETIFKITFWLGYLNSCINPIIYPCFSQEFKRAFHNVLRGRCLRTTVPTAKPPGHTSAHSSSPGPTSSASAVSVQSHGPASSWACCRLLSTSSSSVSGLDQAQNTPAQSKSLLKAWCFSARQTPIPQDPSGRKSKKVLRLSLAISGEPVWLSAWRNHQCAHSLKASRLRLKSNKEKSKMVVMPRGLYLSEERVSSYIWLHINEGRSALPLLCRFLTGPDLETNAELT